MFLADITNEKMQADERLRAVVLEADETEDPVLINERLGWDDHWKLLRILPTRGESFIRLDLKRGGTEANPDWLAVLSRVPVFGDKVRFPPLATRGHWLTGDDPRCRKGRVYVYFEGWSWGEDVSWARPHGPSSFFGSIPKVVP